jgi:hypothetical protein
MNGIDFSIRQGNDEECSVWWWMWMIEFVKRSWIAQRFAWGVLVYEEWTQFELEKYWNHSRRIQDQSYAAVGVREEVEKEITAVHRELEEIKEWIEEVQELSDSGNAQWKLWCIKHELKNFKLQVSGETEEAGVVQEWSVDFASIFNQMCLFDWEQRQKSKLQHLWRIWRNSEMRWRMMDLSGLQSELRCITSDLK